MITTVQAIKSALLYPFKESHPVTFGQAKKEDSISVFWLEEPGGQNGISGVAFSGYHPQLRQQPVNDRFERIIANLDENAVVAKSRASHNN